MCIVNEGRKFLIRGKKKKKKKVDGWPKIWWKNKICNTFSKLRVVFIFWFGYWHIRMKWRKQTLDMYNEPLARSPSSLVTLVLLLVCFLPLFSLVYNHINSTRSKRTCWKPTKRMEKREDYIIINLLKAKDYFGTDWSFCVQLSQEKQSYFMNDGNWKRENSKIHDIKKKKKDDFELGWLWWTCSFKYITYWVWYNYNFKVGTIDIFL